jgi:hypothetical protein
MHAVKFAVAAPRVCVAAAARRRRRGGGGGGRRAARRRARRAVSRVSRSGIVMAGRVAA